jgi:hypothetical protein
MRPVAHAPHIVRSSNPANETIAFSFDEQSIEFLMDVMTNLYQDPALAVIREYSSNALDSHIDAGNPDPIQVTLPTWNNRTFTVEDRGLGMSVDDIRRIYTKYGYSTKRQSDAVVGMLGLGSKAGLAYSKQFVLVAVKNGVKAHAIITENPDTGAGEIEIADTSSTDEPNGVTISINVADVDSFRQKAKHFFKFWTPGTVLVDGEEPSLDADDAVEVSDNITVFRRSLDNDYIVMGCVAYPVGSQLSKGLPYGYNVVAYVPMGSVEPAPPREGLKDTATTRATIADINERREAGTKEAAERDIATAKTHADAVRSYVSWRPLLPSVAAEYQGEAVPPLVRAEDGKEFFIYNKSRYARRTKSQARFETEAFVDSIVVTGFTNGSLSTQNRTRADMWASDNGHDTNIFLFTDKPIGGVWANGVVTVTWDEIKRTTKLSSSSRGRTQAKGTYNVYDGSWDEVEHVDTDHIILVSPSDVNMDKKDATSAQALYALFPDSTVVVTSANRWDKFRREHGSDRVHTAVEALDAFKEKFVNELTDDEYLVLSGRANYIGGYNSVITKLDADRVDDPMLREAIRLASPSEDIRNKSHTWGRLNTVRRAFGWVYSLPERNVEAPEILDSYPFLQYTCETEHVYEYVNSVYNARKETA